ncbi:MAG: hypothetical protein ACM3US_10720 [Sphingomonadaceae bacterium]
MPKEKIVEETDKTMETELSPLEYAEFIHQIELDRVWLKEASVTNRYGPVRPVPSSNSVKVEGMEWEPTADGFRALHRLKVDIRHRGDADEDEEEDGARLAAEIRVVFAVDYSSSLPMTDALFSRFRKSNLPLNTWPYLREFVSSMTSRMNWQDYYVPTLKVGRRPPSVSQTAMTPEPAPKRRRSTRARKDLPATDG